MAEPTAHRNMKHGCIVMASGTATRFGGNKLLAEAGGIPLVEHVVRTTDGLFAKRVVVTRSAEVAALARSLGAEAILHDEPLRNDAVRLGTEATRSCDDVTFFQGDQPLIGAASVRRLLVAAEGGPGSIWRAAFRGEPGAPVLFPSWAYNELRALPAGKGGGFVARAHPERVRTVEVESKWELFDVDTAEDLRVLRVHLAKRDDN